MDVGGLAQGRDPHRQRIRATAVALASQMAAECLSETGFDRPRAVELIVDVISDSVTAAVADEREECAQIAEVLEPEPPVTIAELIRERPLTG